MRWLPLSVPSPTVRAWSGRSKGPDGAFVCYELTVSRGTYRYGRPIGNPDLGLASSATVTRDRLKDLQVGIEDRPGDVTGTLARLGNVGPVGPVWH